MRRSKQYTADALTCVLCGKDDVSIIGKHVGTSTKMRCLDCCVIPGVMATRCRDCCPTRHATRWDPPLDAGAYRHGSESPLSAVLARLGLAYRARASYGFEIVDGDRVIYAGPGRKIWDWLRATGRIL